MSCFLFELVMAFNDLKNNLANGKTQFSDILLVISSLADVQELKTLLEKNKIEVNSLRLYLRGSEHYIADLIPVLNKITGVGHLSLAKSLPNHALGSLLNSALGLNLRHLGIQYDIDQGMNVTEQVAMLETTMVSYLAKSRFLESLLINDEKSHITATHCPKLKMALIKHPVLTDFSLGVGSATIKPNVAPLDRDGAIIMNLTQKHLENEEIKKKFIAEYTRDIESLIKLWSLPQYGFQNWTDIKRTIERDSITINTFQNRVNQIVSRVPELQRYQWKLKLLAAYFYLLKLAVVILENSPKISGDTMQKMNMFWYSKRSPLLIDIIIFDEPQHLLNTIQGTTRQFQSLLKTIRTNPFPASYELLTRDQDPLLKAQKLLNDYTKGNSIISRFFHGHWNRHHVPEVHRIVQRIGTASTNGIHTMDDLLIALKSITLVNPNGSLSRRIAFLESVYYETETPAATPSLALQ